MINSARIFSLLFEDLSAKIRIAYSSFINLLFHFIGFAVENSVSEHGEKAPNVVYKESWRIK